MKKLISRLQVMKLHATVIAESRFFPRGCETNHNLPLRRKFFCIRNATGLHHSRTASRQACITAEIIAPS
jgi:hypothetical protein